MLLLVNSWLGLWRAFLSADAPFCTHLHFVVSDTDMTPECKWVKQGANALWHDQMHRYL